MVHEERKDNQTVKETPASPMRPGEETSIEGGASTEEISTEEENITKMENSQEVQLAWHRKTRPAESDNGPSQLELEQVSYLVLWLQKDEIHRRRWEASWGADQTVDKGSR